MQKMTTTTINILIVFRLILYCVYCWFIVAWPTIGRIHNFLKTYYMYFIIYKWDKYYDLPGIQQITLSQGHQGKWRKQ